MYPQLSQEEAQARWKLLQKNTVYPISVQWAKTVNNAAYPTVDASALGQYRSSTIQQKTAYGLAGVRLTNALATITGLLVVAVSYSPTFTIADGNNDPLVPDDAGNVIYRAVMNTAAYNEFVWFKDGPDPDNHFVEALRPIYIHQWASNAAIAAASMTAQGFLTLYAEFTGIRT